MKRFHYTLEHLLSLRLYAEREAEMEMAGIIARRSSLENDRKQLLEARSEPFARNGRLDLGLEQARGYYRMRLDRDLSRIRDELESVESELEAARAKFTEKRRSREVLERLRRLREDRHYSLERKREESEMNDLIGSRAVRSRSGGL